MGFYEHFPYSNFHELNLDWVLERTESTQHEVEKSIEIANEAVKSVEGVVEKADSAVEIAQSAVDESATATAIANTAMTRAEEAVGATAKNSAFWRLANLGRLAIFGDSYAEGVATGKPTDHYNSFVMQAVSRIWGNSSHPHYPYLFRQGGCGFTGKKGTVQESTNLKWETHVRNFASTKTEAERAEFYEIYFVGGFNDHYTTADNVFTDMANCIIATRNLFPNATVYVGMCGWCGFGQATLPTGNKDCSTIRRDIRDNVLPAYRRACEVGAVFMGNMTAPLHRYETAFDEDNYHPNNAGHDGLGKWFTDFLLNKSAEYHQTGLPFIIRQNNGQDIGLTYYMSINNNVVNLWGLTEIGLTPSADSTRFSEIPIGTVVQSPILGVRLCSFGVIARSLRTGEVGIGQLRINADDSLTLILPFANSGGDTVGITPSLSNCFDISMV